MAAYEVLLLNTAIPQIQAAQSGDTYVVPRDIAFSAALTLSAGTANGVPYLNASKVLTTGSALTFDGTKLGVASGNIDVVSASFVGSPLIAARFNASNLRMGIGIGNSNGFPFLGANVNNAANDNGTFDINGYASRIRLDNGVFQVQTSSVSGTAGNAITWTTPLYLDSSGNLGIGETNPGQPLVVSKNYNGSTWAQISNTTSGTGAAAGVLLTSDSGIQASLELDSTGYTTYGNMLRLRQNGAYPIGFFTSNTERARITSAGITLTDGAVIFSGNATAPATNVGIYRGGAADNLIFATGGSERARITSGGYFKASNSGSYDSSTGTYHELYQTANSRGVLVRATNATYTSGVLDIFGDRTTTNSSFDLIRSSNGNATGQFFVRDSGNALNTNGSYGAISDQKLKQDIVDAGSQWADLKAIRFRKYRMKADVAANPDAPALLGVVAQELEQVSPGLVEESPDRDAEGNDLGTTTKSVKTSVLLMKAAVALQEAMARIEQLEAKVASLGA